MSREPKIVLYDIETIPNLQQALENWCDLDSFKYKKPRMSASVNSICSYAYRVFGESKTHSVNAWDFPAWKKDVNDDREILKVIQESMVDADAIVDFNGGNFDKPFIQGRLGIWEMEWLRKSIKQIDLCAVTYKNLFLLNNRLKTVANYLLKDKKMEHDGWPLWVRVHGGLPRKRDRAAETLMTRYNVKDVDLMVPLFKRYRPLITNIPNYNLFDIGKEPVCPNCQSTRLQSRGSTCSATRIYKRYQCKDCGSWARTDAGDRNPRAI